MGRSSKAARSHVDLARVSLGIGDELRNRPRRDRWIHLHHVGRAADARDRLDVAEKIKVELSVKGRVDRICRGGEEKRIAVRYRPHDRLGPDTAGGARTVFDNELLPESL